MASNYHGTVRSRQRKSCAGYITNIGWTSALREPLQVSADDKTWRTELREAAVLLGA